MSPAVATARCARCLKARQKCVLDASGTSCARCVNTGYPCELPQLLAGEGTEDDDAEAQNKAAPKSKPARPNNNSSNRSRHKCDTCRRHHMTCHPTNRVWPQKCQRCIYKGYECGPPRSKKESDEAVAQDPNGGLIPLASGAPRRRRRQSSKRQSPPHSEEHFQPVVSDVLYTADDDRDDESSTDDSIPAVLPAKRGKPRAASPPPPKRQARGPDPPVALAFGPPAADDDDDACSAQGAKLVQLKSMVRTMEEEFREVLRGEQVKYEQELSSLRTKHEADLKEQRDRYEARIDDLIKILSSTIPSRSS